MTIERRNKNAGSLAGVGEDAQQLRFGERHGFFLSETQSVEETREWPLLLIDQQHGHRT